MFHQALKPSLRQGKYRVLKINRGLVLILRKFKFLRPLNLVTKYFLFSREKICYQMNIRRLTDLKLKKDDCDISWDVSILIYNDKITLLYKNSYFFKL